MEPASTKGMPFFTTSYITPERRPGPTPPPADAARAVDGVDGVEVVAAAALDRAAAHLADAQARLQDRLLEVVGGEGVAGEQHVHPARRAPAAPGRTSPPEWTMAGPATTTIFSPASRVLRISRAAPAITMPLLISAETSFDMKPNTEKSRLRSGGRTRMPGAAQGHRLALRAPAPASRRRARPSRRTSAQSIFWSRDGHPAARRCARRCRSWSWSRTRRAGCRPPRRARSAASATTVDAPR